MSINDILNQLIFIGAIEEEVEAYGTKFTLRTLTTEQNLEIASSTAQYSLDDVSRVYALRIQILARALVAVNGAPLEDLDKKIELVGKFQPILFNKLYAGYESLLEKQNESLTVDEIKKLVDDPYSRMKFKVLKAMKALPSEERVQKLNDAQWLWLYMNELKDEEEYNEKIDSWIELLSYVINPEIAKRITEIKNKHKEQQKAKNIKKSILESNTPQQEKDNKSMIFEHENHDEYIINEDDKFSTDFETELAKALEEAGLTEEDFVELPSADGAGDASESEEDFLKRVMAFEDYAREQMMEMMNARFNEQENPEEEIVDDKSKVDNKKSNPEEKSEQESLKDYVNKNLESIVKDAGLSMDDIDIFEDPE